MKIYLFLNDKLLHFLLPKDSVGSYSFDEFPHETSKLINIEADDNGWCIYSTSYSKVYENNVEVEKLKLETSKFYTLKRNEIFYLIYVCSLDENIIKAFNYDKNFTVTVGKNEKCNIRLNHSQVSDICARITFNNDTITLEKNNSLIYVNDLAVTASPITIAYGAQINVYFFKVIILPNIILMFGNKNVDFSNYSIANLKKISYVQEEPTNLDFKDIDLYEKKDYFFKSPRLRRFIETKDIKFSKPPSNNSNEDLPIIMTVGPMITMGIISAVNLSQSLSTIISGDKEISAEWPKLLTSGAMLASMLVWPLVTKWYNKRLKKKRRKILEQKYNDYLNERRVELDEEVKYQSDVLRENLLSTGECLNIISKGGYNFWDRRSDQNDFLQVRLGIGTQALDVKINYSEDDFTVDEDNLKKQADKLVEDYKNIYNVPVKYSLYDNKITAVIGNSNKCHVFVNNLIIQLLTFYTYEDIKIVVFTNEANEHYWDYLKYTNHNFSNAKDIRLFSTDIDSAKNVSDYLNFFANQRIGMKRKDSDKPLTPHFILIIDNYSSIKGLDFIKLITENEDNIGFSIVMLEDRLSDLPSRCNNFILIGQNSKCEVIMNSSESQQHLEFNEESLYNLNYMQIARKLANIPIEFESGVGDLPDSVTFLEMEKVGKVEQLNILNRWNTNDSTVSLKAEVGVDTTGNLIYLDLHEKAHGPHGLIAGTTGSGKSEFIITYILSLCINFSPDIVSFVLIDYKGGGLALAFENRSTGVILPHLAGTITNLDKADMDRTLVSIDSEIKRRQKLFNEAREMLEESTIDIYKYQRFYKEGRLKEPITHLFIICDEFAELKSQQPEFMDNLISVARIGRSLGVHLILATQKPSGVVNDQIWSNSKFKVCLKVQDEGDSKEMLKKPDAAYIKQAGRFYLQVGYDEYYILGQSGWAGAKYYPSDAIVKEVDKSLNFINDSGRFIKSIKASSGKKNESDGDQFSAVMNSIIAISEKTGKKSIKLWLENIQPIILVDELEKKYNISFEQNNFEAIIGEYDAPELQFQGIVKFNYLEDGNTIIYGNDGAENEMLLNAIIYSTCQHYNSEAVNFYAIDYGSESLRKFEKLPQFGGIAYSGDEEKYANLIKLVRNEIKRRKKILSDFGGDYKSYIKNNKMPLMIVIINNYEAINDNNQNFFEIIPELVRDSERYGIIFVVTCNTVTAMRSKVTNSFSNIYAFKLKDKSDYYMVFGSKASSFPRDIFGRGFVKHELLHEFQTASIVENSDELSDKISEFVQSQINLNQRLAKQIPTLPDYVRFDTIKEEISNLTSVPIGVSRDDLDVVNVDFISEIGNIIVSNKLEYAETFIKSLIVTLKSINSLELYIIDPLKKLELRNFNNYFTDNLDQVIENLKKYVEELKDKKIEKSGLIVIYGLDKFILKLEDKKKFEELINIIKSYEKIGITIVDDPLKIKNYLFEAWFKMIFNVSNGIWVGKGIYNQALFRITALNKEMQKDIPNNMGYVISEGNPVFCKLLDYFTVDDN